MLVFKEFVLYYLDDVLRHQKHTVKTLILFLMKNTQWLTVKSYK